jgi:prolipoprotein diacylglyceryltransferase
MKDMKDRTGFLTGVFFIGVFFTRFLIEFVKENQEAFENGMALNMGQILSIPFILTGIWLIYSSLTNPPVFYKNK